MLKKITKKLKNLRLIDYALLTLLIPVILFGVFYLRRQKAFVYVDLTFQRAGWDTSPLPPEYWQVADIHVGDVVYNNLGGEIATVTDVEKNVWGRGLRSYIELQLKVEAIYDTRSKKYVLNGDPLLIGNTFSVDLGTSKFDGLIKNVYLNPEEKYKNFRKAKALIEVKLKEVDLWQAENLRNFVQVDSKNQVTARVLDISVVPAEVAIPTAMGALVKTQHPIKKDAIITLELPRVLCDRGSCFSNGYNTFAVGDNFWADSGTAVIPGASVMKSEVFDSNWQ